MTAIVLAFTNNDGLEQATTAAASRGLDCHAFPQGLGRRGSNSFFRRWILKNLPHALPAPSVMVVPLTEQSGPLQAPNIMCDLAFAVKQPENVRGFLVSDD